ncbi:transmembrane protein 104 isoform X2 [Strongylocentrotus purpuratus]|uniref:Amino acid transporter transmembrane domain-containing protein n=1 Tax=Strongylocentrotus purpuratus TaxID=7668 RepID=A0A7M7NQE6_STRPU|nr:transmembrane protein 104 isoform X2 [Strongylocentrotus purpuratus]
MAGPLVEPGTSFSPWVGLIFVFNLIVGTGALTMPKAFGKAGWILSSVIIIVLALVSYITATFVIEAMAAANGIIKYRRKDKKREDGSIEVRSSSSSPPSSTTTSLRKSDSKSPPGASSELPAITTKLDETSSTSSSSSSDPYIPDTENDEKEKLLSGNTINYSSVRAAKKHADYFEITELVDMGQMASMFFNKIGQILFYICLIVYLYGDLAIYAVAVPKSLRDITCTYDSDAHNLSDNERCWPGADISRMNAYRIYLSIFALALGVFVYFNVQKTKYLQIFTTIMRWLAFLTMIISSVVYISQGKSSIKPAATGPFESIPNFFGVCVYAFMCHHSLPSLITPVNPKKRITAFLFGDYILILLFYLFLSVTAIFTFESDKIQDIYTLNFFKSAVLPVIPLQYFVALFPVFTLSTNFPIIGITLRNNLMALFLHENKLYHWTIRRLLFPTLVLVPPIVVAFVTTNVTMLVGITGSYAGATIQYLIPVFLVYCGRKKTERMMGKRWILHQHMSPFRHRIWLVLIIIWAIFCLAFVTVDHVLEGIHS